MHCHRNSAQADPAQLAALGERDAEADKARDQEEKLAEDLAVIRGDRTRAIAFLPGWKRAREGDGMGRLQQMGRWFAEFHPRIP